MLLTNRQALLDQRQVISVADYEALFYEEPSLDQDGNASFSPYLTGRFALKEIKEHQRIYQDDDKN